MYKIKLWDEDKWNIHSTSYNSSKYGNLAATDKGEKAYHEQKYGSEGGGLSLDYIKKDELKEREESKRSDFDDIEEKEEGIKEEETQINAAKQLFNEAKYEAKETKKPGQGNTAKTIEDAIKKAIEEEKKVIIMDS